MLFCVIIIYYCIDALEVVDIVRRENNDKFESIPKYYLDLLINGYVRTFVPNKRFYFDLENSIMKRVKADLPADEFYGNHVFYNLLMNVCPDKIYKSYFAKNPILILDYPEYVCSRYSIKPTNEETTKNVWIWEFIHNVGNKINPELHIGFGKSEEDTVGEYYVPLSDWEDWQFGFTINPCVSKDIILCYHKNTPSQDYDCETYGISGWNKYGSVFTSKIVYNDATQKCTVELNNSGKRFVINAQNHNETICLCVSSLVGEIGTKLTRFSIDSVEDKVNINKKTKQNWSYAPKPKYDKEGYIC